MAQQPSQADLTRLNTAEEDAEVMAILGEVAGGFLLLAQELRRARELWSAGEAGGEALAKECQRRMDDYAERHHLKSNASGVSLWTVPQSPRWSEPQLPQL